MPFLASIAIGMSIGRGAMALEKIASAGR